MTCTYFLLIALPISSADDTTIHMHGEIVSEVESKLQHDFNNTGIWMKQNKMYINFDKTTCMTVGTTKNA